MTEKRVVNVVHQEGLKNLNNLLFVGVMMAVGVVLRLCAGFLAVAGMQWNPPPGAVEKHPAHRAVD